MCAVTAALAIAQTDGHLAWLEVSARVLMVAAPIAVGLYAQRREPFERFGTLLIVVGIGWFLASLSMSTNEWLYSAGRVFGWLIELGLIYVLLAFPTGGIEGPARLIVQAAAVLVGVLYLPTALLVESYPSPVPYSSCETGCPPNAFMIVASEPGWVDEVVRPLRELLTVALFAVATVLVAGRLRHASEVVRQALGPVLIVAMFRLVALPATLAVREVAPDSAAADAGVWLLSLSVPALAFAFLIGVVRWRLFLASAMERLAARLRTHPQPADLRDALADAFGDPSIEIVYWIREPSGHWGDAAGLPVDGVPGGPGRHVTEVFDGDQRIAAIIHDPVLRHGRAFIESATAYAVMTLDNHRLSAQTRSLLREVRKSRARIQEAADDERRRIEHDLHDGAQQRLVALRIKIELAAERASGNGNGSGAGDAALLRGLGTEVEEALDEVRSLARGVYPAPLAARGLVEAIRSAAQRAMLPTTVLAAGVGRYSQAIETAAYFSCVEALQNVAKHATGATGTVIEIMDDGSLSVEVRDDGAGFEMSAVQGGVGFTSMRDRLAAVGGTLEIESTPGRGTRVHGSIPLDA
jgi:signal transduction histidine kinase